MNAAIDDVRAAIPQPAAESVSVERVQSVNADSDDISRFNLRDVHPFQRLVLDNRVTEAFGTGRSQHVEPTRSNNANAE
jgi:hypothetical protein